MLILEELHVEHHCLIILCFVDIGGFVDHHCLIFLCFIDIGGIVDHHWLNFLCFVGIGGIVDHHCLIFLCFVDIGGIVDHHCLNFLFIIQTKDGGYRGQRAWRTNTSIGSSNVTDSFLSLEDKHQYW